ncbi:MAG: hypothetical protein O2865_11195 [Planctomycetota bacterium]|nr:hypothetical protein [Planctomycetota bacterium]MDA0933642.1 hypothetical protein [Planctomycetota bacterium]MDA1223344.1 hypothetical protein [Planctomycetota bacterium]
MEPSRRQPARLAALLGCITLLSGCGALPQDHAAADLVGRSGAGLRRTLGRFPAFFEDQERGLRRIGAHLASFPDRAGQDTVRLGRSVADSFGKTRDAIASFLPTTSGGLESAASRELRGVRDLGASGARMSERFGRDVAAVRRDALDLPARLHVFGDVMPMPTDRERTVDLDPAPRRRTLLERILDRMAL